MIKGPLQTVCPFAVPGLFWCEAVFDVQDVQVLRHDGWQIELPADLTKAVAKRRSEFLAGRLCAAAALRLAGAPEKVGRQGRAPAWPAGIGGSITHSRTRAIAAVSRSLICVGLDCEDLMSDARAEDLSSAIIRGHEAGMRPDGMRFGVFLTLVFSAKEALYKAHSARLDAVPEFHDVTVQGLTADYLTLELQGATHVARYVLSDRDCLTMVAE